ncbi:hypothetical protein DMUE_3224 [Dictyocoela muelleri]|nr:hypothetical protein DMUE_3224 [Dictyocoela muelleri]
MANEENIVSLLDFFSQNYKIKILYVTSQVKVSLVRKEEDSVKEAFSHEQGNDSDYSREMEIIRQILKSQLNFMWLLILVFFGIIKAIKNGKISYSFSRGGFINYL